MGLELHRPARLARHGDDQRRGNLLTKKAADHISAGMIHLSGGRALTVHRRLHIRRWHRWVAVIVAPSFLVVIVSGILLQLKKDWDWVQPVSRRGVGRTPEISFEQILSAAASAHPGIRRWDDVERLDIQPGRGIAKVQARDRWEVQVDLLTADVLQKAYRRSDLIESLHDGSWFHDGVKHWVFLPAAALVFVLWTTGIYLFVSPIAARMKKRDARRRLGD
jgi:uncharacterized iron-regulated membrane protein